jgi:cell division protein FtsL
LRVPPFERFTGLMKSVGLLLSGAIIGCALFTAIYHHHLNFALVQNKELRSENEKLEQDINTIKKSRNQMSTVNQIEVIVESGDLNPLDKVTAQEIERRVRNDLDIIKGQRIAAIAESPHVYQRLLAQKTYHAILDKDYTVNVKTMLLIQNELKVWVIAKEWKRTVP